MKPIVEIKLGDLIRFTEFVRDLSTLQRDMSAPRTTLTIAAARLEQIVGGLADTYIVPPVMVEPAD